MSWSVHASEKNLEASELESVAKAWKSSSPVDSEVQVVVDSGVSHLYAIVTGIRIEDGRIVIETGDRSVDPTEE